MNQRVRTASSQGSAVATGAASAAGLAIAAAGGDWDPTHGASGMGSEASVRLAEPKRGGGGGSSGGGSGGRRDRTFLSEEEIQEVEQTYSEGISAVEVVDVFASRGIRFSEATFRKYVQQGLLPRSKRVGRKGKNRGSMGVYPAKTVRRVNAIKRLMAEGYTIEEIQAQHLRHTDLMESIEENVGELLNRFEDEVQGPRFDNRTRKNLERELSEARKTADDLLKRIEGLSRRVAAPEQERFRSTGAAGSAEDLL